jgi:AcrR family transcriptional regulator
MKKGPAMHMANSIKGQQTRKQILDAALTQFADHGYAGASVRDIAASAQTNGATLYYHFGSKAGLFQALVDLVEDESFEPMVDAVGRGERPLEKLVEVCVALFRLASRQRDVVRLTLGQSLLAQGKAPAKAQCLERTCRCFAMIERLMERGLVDGTFRRQLSSERLALGFLGMVHSHIIAHLTNPQHPLTRRTAEEIVSLFVEGAAANGRRKAP